MSQNFQYTAKATCLTGDHPIKAGFLYEDVDYSQVNQRTGPTFTAPDGRQTATGARDHDPPRRQLRPYLSA